MYCIIPFGLRSVQIAARRSAMYRSPVQEPVSSQYQRQRLIQLRFPVEPLINLY